jgi:hypothetical protein
MPELARYMADSARKVALNLDARPSEMWIDGQV